MQPISVLIADDHSIVRRGMTALLAGKERITIVGAAGDGETAVALAHELQPDVILMDLKMPRLDGVSAIRQIRQARLKSKILVITTFSEEPLVIAALRAGADGYLTKSNMPDVPDALYAAILEVAAGGAPLDPAIRTTLLRSFSNLAQDKDAEVEQLTERELAVLQLIASGMSNQQISNALDISVRTAATHVSNILKKLHLENRTQAALYALRHDLVSPPPI